MGRVHPPQHRATNVVFCYTLIHGYIAKKYTVASRYAVSVVTGVAGSSVRAGGPGDRISVEARFTGPVQTFYTMGTGSFPGGKAAGASR
jgi:hypothetical protein